MGKFAGSRTVTIKDPKYENGETIKDKLSLLKELHSPYMHTHLSRQLQSLTLNLDLYEKPIALTLNSLHLPQPLSILRLRFTSINKPHCDITRLPNLKYFVLSDPSLTPALAKRLVVAAINQDMRMLCLLTNNAKRIYSKLGNW